MHWREIAICRPQVMSELRYSCSQPAIQACLVCTIYDIIHIAKYELSLIMRIHECESCIKTLAWFLPLNSRRVFIVMIPEMGKESPSKFQISFPFSVFAPRSRLVSAISCLRARNWKSMSVAHEIAIQAIKMPK